jgi:hypothetical protein
LNEWNNGVFQFVPSNKMCFILKTNGGNETPQLISFFMDFICWMDIEHNGALPFALFGFIFLLWNESNRIIPYVNHYNWKCFWTIGGNGTFQLIAFFFILTTNGDSGTPQ